MQDIPAFVMVMTLLLGSGCFAFLFTELQALRHGVADLQERVDFTERLLARQQDPAGLPRE